jgi:hypothetical protein
MTNIDQLAETLKALSPRQLQKVLAVTPNKKGSKIRANRNARTEKYFSAAPKPHHCFTWVVYRDVTDYMAVLGTQAWLSQSVNHQTKNATIVKVRKL